MASTEDVLRERVNALESQLNTERAKVRSLPEQSRLCQRGLSPPRHRARSHASLASRRLRW